MFTSHERLNFCMICAWKIGEFHPKNCIVGYRVSTAHRYNRHDKVSRQFDLTPLERLSPDLIIVTRASPSGQEIAEPAFGQAQQIL